MSFSKLWIIRLSLMFGGMLAFLQSLNSAGLNHTPLVFLPNLVYTQGNGTNTLNWTPSVDVEYGKMIGVSFSAFGPPVAAAMGYSSPTTFGFDTTLNKYSAPAKTTIYVQASGYERQNFMKSPYPQIIQSVTTP